MPDLTPAQRRALVKMEPGRPEYGEKRGDFAGQRMASLVRRGLLVEKWSPAGKRYWLTRSGEALRREILEGGE